jgi:hypothetical protein
VRPRDRQLAERLEVGLLTFDRDIRPLPGISAATNRAAFLEQILESIHRVEFVKRLRTRPLSPRRADPNDEMFDPLKATILHQRQGNIEEAFWLVFLFVHFGKHARAGWRYAREVYGRLGEGGLWDWPSVSASPAAFRDWLNGAIVTIQRNGIPRGFGNHRKYESLDAYSNNGTGAAVESYVNWVKPPRTHAELMEEACRASDWNPRIAFHRLYQSMSVVARFGRTARFDYLAMIGKLDLASIEPDSTYMQNSTGPVKGARLLFGSEVDSAILDSWVVELGAYLDLGMQVLEDSLCNWQKSPGKFKPFRG